MNSKSRQFQSVTLGAVACMMACMPLAASGQAKPAAAQAGTGRALSGTWAGLWKVLDDGEQDRTILELHQTGDQLSGTMITIGHKTAIEGSLKGTHFALAEPSRRTVIQISGDVKGNDLYLTRNSIAFTAVPAKPGDSYPPFSYIKLPALHNVPANGLAKLPPMGWNSWNFFGERTDDKIIRAAADAMATNGMRDAGYRYINIDDTWESTRDAQGNLRPNKKFPDMKALADYVHSKGMKLGIYSSPGPRTCQDYPGSYGHEQQDAKTFASWGIDFLKYDWCGARMIYTHDQMQAVYQKMGEALLESGRPILYSLCQYGTDNVAEWGAKVGGDMWRTTGDIRDTWASMTANIEKQVADAPYAGPGHWNDPDMLEIGNGGMTETEYRTHMTLWAMSAAPLLAGNDLRNMSPAIKSILLNREVIAVDQDTRAIQATPIKNGNLETWVKPLADGSVAVAVVNMGASEATADITTSRLGLGRKMSLARDLWAHADVTFRDGTYTARVASHGVLMLRVKAAR